jgi:hypothetical protein
MIKIRFEVSKKLRRWQFKEKLKDDDSYYQETLDDMIWYHLERNELYYDDKVESLKKWRKARAEFHEIIKSMKNKLEIEWRTRYFGSKNDPPILRIPKGSIFEAWDSFNIVSFEIYCFGFSDLESLLSFTVKFSQPYSSEYCEMVEKIKHYCIFDNGWRKDNYNWHSSSFYEKMLNEICYRGWVKNHVEYLIECSTALRTLKEIEKMIDLGIKFEYEP